MLEVGGGEDKIQIGESRCWSTRSCWSLLLGELGARDEQFKSTLSVTIHNSETSNFRCISKFHK